MGVRIRWDWLEGVGEGGKGYCGWDGVVDRVELRGFKGILTVQLYSAKAYSHPTVYVYSKRLT